MLHYPGDGAGRHVHGHGAGRQTLVVIFIHDRGRKAARWLVNAPRIRRHGVAQSVSSLFLVPSVAPSRSLSLSVSRSSR